MTTTSKLATALSLLLACSSAEAGETCGDASIELLAGQTIPVGSVDVSNDATTLTISYNTTGGWELTEIHAHVACSLDDIPQTKSGNPKVGNFDYNVELDTNATSYDIEIDIDGIECLGGCGNDLVIATHAAVQLIDGGEPIQGETAWGDGGDFPGKSWATYFNYTVDCCEEPPPEECADPGDFRTQTQGGWGTSCNGDNPGCYRDDNFSAAFPNGLVAGDASYYTLTLSNAGAVEVFLPQGGTPAALDANYYDPTTTSAGVLGGQMTALHLSVGFDDYDASFGASNTALSDLYAQDGTCFGMTVQQILDAGDCVLSGQAGCGFSASEINDCLSSANESFVDGESVSGYLCPDAPIPPIEE